ncbi:MAG TPA: hypothetical protein VLW53_16210 [Candidatus Eisenbacteria bacterium]|nr:hypothetical protein [Candidatus Eisenbacteria bacterium]
MKFYLFGSLRGQKRRARDIDLVVALDDGEAVEGAMTAVASIAPRVRKPIELWLSHHETEPNLAGNYDYRSQRWAFWRRPGLPGFFRGLEPITLDHVVRLALAAGPYGPNRRGGVPEAGSGPDCAVRRRPDGWHYDLAGRRDGPYPGPLEAAAAAEAAAKAGGELERVRALWFRLEAPPP